MFRRNFLHVPTVALAQSSIASADESYWRNLRREHFFLPDWRVYLNTGSVGAAPKSVVHATNQYLEQGATYSTNDYPRWGYESMDAHRTLLANFLGTTKEELALTHNATESMSLIANGLDLKPNDEVLLTDQEHPSGRGCWLLKQARNPNIKIREAKLPIPPRNSQEIADAILSQLRPETRVLSFSAITTHTGLLLPVKQICATARAKGVITIVDAAHMPGQLPFRIDDFGCDALAASLHKWMLTPPGCGILYVRRDFQAQLWPTIVVEGSQSLKDATKYMQLGCNNRAELEGTRAAIDFFNTIGPQRIYDRIHALARHAHARAQAIHYLNLLSSPDHNLYAGMIAFTIPGKNYAPLWAKFAERKIWTLRGEKIRISSHIHTRMADLDLAFDTIKEVFG
jgi:selenocysteine lyase/cysteine desulfurase